MQNIVFVTSLLTCHINLLLICCASCRRKSILTHQASASHQLCVASKEKSQTGLIANLNQAQRKRNEAILLAMKVLNYTVNEELANCKYKSQLKFLRELKVQQAMDLNMGGNASYDSPDIFNQMLDCLNDVIVDEMKVEIQASPAVGIGVDESTDRTQEKHVAFIIRYITSAAHVKTTFLRCKKVEKADANHIFQSLLEALQEFNIPTNNVAGLGSDGANVMSGHRSGLNALMKAENPFCVYVHCVCHRLALAVSQAYKSIPSLETLHECVAGVYNLVNTQPTILQRFKDMSDILELDVVKFKKIYDIRWLSFGESVTAIIRNYEVLMPLLEELAAEGNPTAIGLHKQLTSYLFVALLHFVADVLAITNHSSKLFQYKDVSFSCIRSTVSKKLIVLQIHDKRIYSKIDYNMHFLCWLMNSFSYFLLLTVVRLYR